MFNASAIKMQAIRTNDLYQRFFKACKQAFADRKCDNVQKEANAEWNKAKECYGADKQRFVEFIQSRINYYDVQETKRKIGLLSYFGTSVS